MNIVIRSSLKEDQKWPHNAGVSFSLKCHEMTTRYFVGFFFSDQDKMIFLL